MKPSIVTLEATDGSTVEYVDEVVGRGGMKDVYFSPDKSYVVAFYRKPQDQQAMERLDMLVGKYRDSIFANVGSEYWKKVYCWPTKVVKTGDAIGIVVPAYDKKFYFEHGSTNDDQLGIRGKEKQGKWFAAANLHFRFIASDERGDWSRFIQICLQTARAVKRLHAAGLAHSDLSYKNVLIDPSTGQACIIDIDGLVVPGRYPPDVVGTPDFIAPEVVQTSHLKRDDANKKLPSIDTDRHALAVLMYMYLLYRHPLKGRKVRSTNVEEDSKLEMGEDALFVEHSTDHSNRIDVEDVKPSDLPWADCSQLPYTLTGPYLSALFKRAFEDGLHDPRSRPTADEWETALVRTVDLIQPCNNIRCGQKWFVFDNSLAPRCPFCRRSFHGALPILNLYSKRGDSESYRSDNHRLMVYSNQSLFQWHTNRLVVPNEKLVDSQKTREGYFVHHNNIWWLVNERMIELEDIGNKKAIAAGESIALVEGLQLRFSKADGGRLAVVQIVGED